MAEYLSPGVYVEEVERGSKPIAGVSTSTAGFLGETVRGPTEPRLITSFADFERLYGSYTDDSTLPYAVQGFFQNGGSRCFVGRIVPDQWHTNPDATGSATLSDSSSSDAITVEANGPGNWSNGILVKISDATMGGSDSFKATIGYWKDQPDFGSSPDYDTYVDNNREPDIEEVYDELKTDKTASGYYETAINGVSPLVDFKRADGGRPANGTTQLSASASYPGESSSSSSSSDSDSDSSSSSSSSSAPSKLSWYEGVDEAGERTGLAAFEEIDEISMVIAPDENDVSGLTDKLQIHCEVDTGDRVAILQCSAAPGPVSDISRPVTSSFAAFYYPWVTIIDPETGLEKDIPPGGHIAGIYARSDSEHGVHKAPANEVVNGIQGLQRNVSKGDQDILNPKGINCIRSFRGRGIRVWGARTCASDPIWKYVNVRRLFLYLEESIDEGTQWVVFESNDEQLWSRVEQTVSNFLETAWRDGALMGSTPEEAFYVKCDRTTMTQADIDNGRLICEIGVAPVKPAEFVIFRIGQWTGGVEGGE